MLSLHVAQQKDRNRREGAYSYSYIYSTGVVDIVAYSGKEQRENVMLLEIPRTGQDVSGSIISGRGEVGACHKGAVQSGEGVLEIVVGVLSAILESGFAQEIAKFVNVQAKLVEQIEGLEDVERVLHQSLVGHAERIEVPSENRRQFL